MYKQNILIYASELSSCIGKNPYKDKSEAIKKTYYRNNGQILREKPLEILEKIDETLLYQFDNTLNTNQVINNIENNNRIIETLNLSQDEKIILNDYMKNSYCTQHGIIQEDKINLNYCRENNLVIKKDNVFHKKLLYTDDNYNIFLGGKCDGIIDNTCLVEIKTRMYKLFKEIREYEKIQVHSYLFIYNITKAKLIEKYKDEMMEHEIKFDVDEFDILIKEEMPKFIKIYNEFI